MTGKKTTKILVYNPLTDDCDIELRVSDYDLAWIRGDFDAMYAIQCKQAGRPVLPNWNDPKYDQRLAEFEAYEAGLGNVPNADPFGAGESEGITDPPIDDHYNDFWEGESLRRGDG